MRRQDMKELYKLLEAETGLYHRISDGIIFIAGFFAGLYPAVNWGILHFIYPFLIIWSIVAVANAIVYRKDPPETIFDMHGILENKENWKKWGELWSGYFLAKAVAPWLGVLAGKLFVKAMSSMF